MRKMRLAPLVTIIAPLLILAGCGGRAASPAASTAQPAAAGSGTQAGARASAGSGAAGQTGRRFASIAVQAVAVISGPLVTDNDTAGTVLPVTQSQVAAQVSGVVSKVVHQAGDIVKAGVTVVQLDDAALRLAVANAQSALDNAKINLESGQQTTTGSSPKLADQLQSAQTALASAQKNYDSQKALYDLGGISSSQLDTAKSSLDQAQANVAAAQLALDQNQQAGTQTLAQFQLAVDQANNQLAIARLNLQNASIKAPFTGQIAAVNVSPGMFVSQNTSVFLLVSLDKQINFTEPPTDAPNFKAGDMVQFNYGGKSYPVRLTQTPSAPINGVVPMVAAVPSSLPVSYGTVGTITYKLTIATGPQIPISALQSRANMNFVDVVVNGKAVEQSVIILAESGTTAVVSGVNAGDEVIINPPPGLLNGSTVQVVAPQSAQGQTTGQQGARGTGSSLSGNGQGQRTGQSGSRTGSGGTSTGAGGTATGSGGSSTGAGSGTGSGGATTGKTTTGAAP